MSLTVPTQASALRNNGYMCINNIPCRIIDTTRSKTGKHGGMKIHFSAVDIFTDQRHDHLQMSTQNIDVPYVTKNEYQLVDIDDNIVSYLDDKGSLLNDTWHNTTLIYTHNDNRYHAIFFYDNPYAGSKFRVDKIKLLKHREENAGMVFSLDFYF